MTTTTVLTRVFDQRGPASAWAVRANTVLGRRGVRCLAKGVEAPGGWRTVVFHQDGCDGTCAARAVPARVAALAAAQ